MPADALINVNGSNVQTLEILFFTTLLMLLPSLVVLMTCFTRYVVVFSFLRSAMGTQTPPNMVLVGMALVLTLFAMAPTLDRVKMEAYDPLVAEEIGQEEFFQRAQEPLKAFMLRQTGDASIELYCNMAQIDPPQSEAELQALPMRVVLPAFVTTELKTAFEIGFLLYIPFMLIDMIVASTLMSMGMVMLPPSMIATPFKLLLFILLDGWQLLFSTLIQGIK